jgi:hypothetical protein
MGENYIRPDYYNDTNITPFDVIDAWGMDFYLGNVLKYIKRAGKKDNNSRLQDLRKAQEYLSAEILREEAKQ